MTSPSTPHAQLSVAVLQPRYPTPRLYSRVAGSTLVVTSCSANTLFITLLTPSTPCTRVRSAFQSARIKALNTVRRAQTGAVSGWPYLLPTPSLPRSFHVYISPPPRGISPPPLPSFLLLSKSETIRSNRDRMRCWSCWGLKATQPPFFPPAYRVSRLVRISGVS